MLMITKMGMILTLLLLNLTGCVSISKHVWISESEEVCVEFTSDTQLEDLLDSKVDTKLK